uniref:Uncharacterized protein n=1 Tax=Rhizophora mucronata TaxID=61149 RepID=A0A2P2R408_RHIMU
MLRLSPFPTENTQQIFPLFKPKVLES